MAFDDALADRVRAALFGTKDIDEKKLFGGLGFMLNGNLLVCVWKRWLIVRLGVDEAEAAMREEHVREFDVTGKTMKGWVMVDADGVADQRSVGDWVSRALPFVAELPAK